MVELEQEQDFIGRDRLRKIAEQGVLRKLVGVEIGGGSLGSYSDGSFPASSWSRRAPKRSANSPQPAGSTRLKKNIGYAMVPAAHSELRTELTVRRPEGVLEAVVADRVFFRPEHAEQELAGPSTSAGADR